MSKAEKKKVGDLITEDDREVMMELARKYLRDDRHAAIQRWAFEKMLPYALPRLASSELKTKDGEGFKIVVEDYRNTKEVPFQEYVKGVVAEDIEEGEDFN